MSGSERKEELRQQREGAAEAARKRERRRAQLGYLTAAVVVIAIGVAAAFLLAGGENEKRSGTTAVLPAGGSVPAPRTENLAEAAKSAGCRLRSVSLKPSRHVQKKVTYPISPPVGGDHFEMPAEDGAYDQAPRQETLVHALEHGRVAVWFKRELSADRRADLKAFFDSDDYQMLLTPDRTGSEFEVAATAWNRDPQPGGTGRLLGCPKMDIRVFDALAAFRDRYRGNGPEAVP